MFRSVWATRRGYLVWARISNGRSYAHTHGNTNANSYSLARYNTTAAPHVSSTPRSAAAADAYSDSQGDGTVNLPIIQSARQSAADTEISINSQNSSHLVVRSGVGAREKTEIYGLKIAERTGLTSAWRKPASVPAKNRGFNIVTKASRISLDNFAVLG
jgi:hypothetical protein